MQDRLSINQASIVEDYDGKLWKIDKDNTRAYSLICQEGLGDTACGNRIFNWFEDEESLTRFTISAQTNGELTVGNDVAKKLVKDDILFCANDNIYLRVIATPGDSATKVNVVQVTGNSEGTPSNINGKSFIKAYTSKSEIDKDDDSFNEFFNNYSNTVSIYEDFAETSDILNAENNHLDEYSIHELEETKKLIKQKGDINTGIYIGHGYYDGRRFFTKGITNFNNVLKQGGTAFESDGKTLIFGYDDYIRFMMEATRYIKGGKIVSTCNRAFYLWVDAMVRATSQMKFDAFGKQNSWGVEVNELRTSISNQILHHDATLDDLYPNDPFCVNWNIKKVGIKHLQGLNTKLSKNVQEEKISPLLSKIRTVGGGLKLVNAPSHSILHLKMTEV